MGVFESTRIKLRAHAAAFSHRRPARHMQVVLVSGADGSQLTIVCLAHILAEQGAKVGIITANFVEIAGERAEGSDQADVFGDSFRLQGLLAQMRRAGCRYALIEVPPQLPPHEFSGLQPTMVVLRRGGDSHLPEAANAARKALAHKLMSLKPECVVINRDDPAYEPIASREGIRMTFGTHDKAECHITGVTVSPKGSVISVIVDHQTELQLTTVLTGKTAIYSVVAAAAAAYMLHAPITAIEDGVRAIDLQPGALHYLAIARPYAIVCDSAATPDGIADSLETLKHFTKNRLIAVVSANLLQPANWQPIIGELAAKLADRLVVTDGEYTAEESATTVRQHFLQGIEAVGADARTDEVPDREAGLEKALSIARRGDTIVVLASTQRPYRQLGGERQPWNDAAKIEELLS